MNYYNEWDKGAAAWLRELIKAGLIPQGYVDERSITEVTPGDLEGFTQCHFFAGIGGWSLALRLAGWPESRPVWTGSAPCQPFSNAGKRKGSNDARHLAPAMLKLIAQCRPSTFFGEQVAGNDGLEWLDDVFSELENSSYACGASILTAAGCGAPHKRERLYFTALDMAHTERDRSQGWLSGRQDQERETFSGSAGCSGAAGNWDAVRWVACRDGKQRPIEPGTFPLADGIPARMGRLRGYGNAIVPQVAAAFIRAVQCAENPHQS